MELKNQLRRLLSAGKLDSRIINSLVEDISDIIGNPAFMERLMSLIDIVCEERDGVTGFSVGDLKVLQQELKSGNFLIITQLVNGIILLLASISNLNIKVNKKKGEELVLKVLVHTLFVEVPKRTGGFKHLTQEDKNMLFDVLLALYDGVKNAQSLNDALVGAMQLFSSGGCHRLFPCCGTDGTSSRLGVEMRKIITNLRVAVDTNRQIVKLQDEVNELRDFKNRSSRGLVSSNVADNVTVATNLECEKSYEQVREPVCDERSCARGECKPVYKGKTMYKI